MNKKKSSYHSLENSKQSNILLNILSYADGNHDIIDLANLTKTNIEEFLKILNIALTRKLIIQPKK